VHTPDLYDGKTFTDLAAGLGYAKQTGFDTIIERGRLASDGSPRTARLGRLAGTTEDAALFLYPGDRHLFTDNSLHDYDESASTVLRQRVLSFLDTIE